MAQANFRAFHFVADSVRVVRELSRHGFTIRAVKRDFSAARHNALLGESTRNSALRPTPEARVFRVDGGYASGQVLAGNGHAVWEGETLARPGFIRH